MKSGDCIGGSWDGLEGGPRALLPGERQQGGPRDTYNETRPHKHGKAF